MLDGVISSGQFSAWVDAHEERKAEQTLWELYLYKLGAYDDRSFDDFKFDMMKGMIQKNEKPSEEQLTATVNKSYDILNNFEILEERG